MKSIKCDYEIADFESVYIAITATRIPYNLTLTIKYKCLKLQMNLSSSYNKLEIILQGAKTNYDLQLILSSQLKYLYRNRKP